VHWSRSVYVQLTRVLFSWRWGGSSTQAWMPTYVSVLRIPQNIWVLESYGGMIYWQGKTEKLGKNLSQCYFVHHKSQLTSVTGKTFTVKISIQRVLWVGKRYVKHSGTCSMKHLYSSPIRGPSPRLQYFDKWNHAGGHDTLVSARTISVVTCLQNRQLQ
jgi:hypothetical protein